MATRKNRTHTQLVRDRIKASAIINRLQDFILEENDVTMTSSQVKAAQILLDRVLPKLKAVCAEQAYGASESVTINVAWEGGKAEEEESLRLVA